MELFRDPSLFKVFVQQCFFPPEALCPASPLVDTLITVLLNNAAYHPQCRSTQMGPFRGSLKTHTSLFNYSTITAVETAQALN